MYSKYIIKRSEFNSECELSDLEVLVVKEIKKINGHSNNVLTISEVYGRLGRILHLKKADTRAILLKLQRKGVLKIISGKNVVMI